MSTTTASPASGFNLGATSSANAGFANFLSSFQPAPSTSAGAASASQGFDPGGLSAQQLAGDINNGTFESLPGAMTLAQLTANPNYASTTAADYQGSIDPDNIDFNGVPLSQLGLGEGGNAYGQTLLGSGYANPGLSYDGQPISNAQQNAAYWQLADSQEHSDGQALGFAAALVASVVAGPEILAGYTSMMGAGAAATIAAGATTGALAGGLDAGISGGDVGKGMLDGAITGGVGGGVSSALSGAVADGAISSTTSAALKGAASAGTGALLNGGQGGFGSVLTSAAIGGVSSGVTGAVSSATGNSFLGGAAGGLTSAALNDANQASQMPSQNSTPSSQSSTASSSSPTPTSASGFNIATPQSLGANQISTSASMPTMNAPTDGAFTLGVNTK